MGQDFIEFPNLPNDSAVVTHIPYTDKEKEMANQTDGYAMDNGWCWTIPCGKILEKVMYILVSSVVKIRQNKSLENI